MLEEKEKKAVQEEKLREQPLDVEYDFEGLPIAYNQVSSLEQKNN